MGIKINGEDRVSTINTKDTTIGGIGIQHLASNPDLYQPKLSSNFMFYVTGFENLISSTTGEKLENAEVYLKVSTDSASVPHFSQSVVTIPRGNTTIKMAGKPEFGTEPIVVNDYIGANIMEILESWQHQSYNPRTEKVGLAGDYKKEAYLVEYTPDWQQVRTWKLFGCWIQELSGDSLSYGNNDTIKVSATIQYDYAYPMGPQEA